MTVNITEGQIPAEQWKRIEVNHKHKQSLIHHIHDVIGISDVGRCSYRLHQGRVEPAGHSPKEAVQRCDAGKY